jgi:PTS system nitrogen regulatory IIA component
MMNDIADLLSVDRVEAALSAPNKKGLFHQLSVSAARRTGLDAKAIGSALTERERIGSTGFGGGVAIPHGRIEGLDRVFGYFARLNAPVDFQSVDNLPVDLVFLILSPPDAGADHLKALAMVSRILRDRTIVAKLRGARSRDAIFALLSGIESRDAA